MDTQGYKDFSSGLVSAPPKSRQVAEYLRNAIQQGKYPPGSKLPSIRSFCKQFSVSPAVIQRAYQLLTEQSLIERAPGSGTYVRDLPSHPVFGLMTTALEGGIPGYFDALQKVADQEGALFFSVPASMEESKLEYVLNEYHPQLLFYDGLVSGISPRRLIKLAGETPVCFVHRWQWDEPVTAPAVLLDFADLYAQAFSMLGQKGHTHVLVPMHHDNQAPFVKRSVHEAENRLGDRKTVQVTYAVEDRIMKKPSKELAVFKKENPPTAIVGYRDRLTLQVYEMISEEIRSEISLELIGGYDTECSLNFKRPFTTFRWDFNEMWKMAARLLKSTGSASEAVFVSPEIIIR